MKTGPVTQPKIYDRRYFDRWYRCRSPVASADALRRKVRFAVSAAEHLLEREIRSVLDVGCGEGRWRAELRRVRPRLVYVGVDSSEYVVRRFGARRGIRLGSLGSLDRLRLGRGFDLIVCSDVLQYVSTAELRRGLRSIRRLLRGVAFIETYPDAESFAGDHEGWQHRSAGVYRKAFRDAGLYACGLSCWVAAPLLECLGPLERLS